MFGSSSNDDRHGKHPFDEFSMKNGCCRECMKAFSKNGKVSLSINFYIRVVFVRCQDFREDRLYHPMDASTVNARGVIP